MSCPSTASPKPAMGHSKHSGGGGPRGKGLKDICIDEEVKIAVNISLERFQYSEQKEIEFPSSLSSTERAFIHRFAQSLGYISKSRGKGSSRTLTIRKKDGSETAQSIMTFNLSHNSKRVVRSFLQRFPITNKECTDLLPHTERGLSVAMEAESSRDKNRTSGRLNNGIPQVPKRRGPSEIDFFRRSLPVYERREEIIPQFLLDDCSRNGIPCRIFCTQPRRLAAIAVAERVAAERGESIGQTTTSVRLSATRSTLLTFCTSGVLLRTLMAGDTTMSTVTHVIVDELHERDGLSDFLLIKMRDMLHTMPNLKLILSSAALDVELFLHYFSSCPVIHIKGRPFEVKQLFLEDILRTTGYANKDMMKYKKESQRGNYQPSLNPEWCKVQECGSRQEPQREKTSASCVLQENDLLIQAVLFQNEKDVASLDPWLLKEMDACISDIFLNQDADAFIQLFNLILSENVSVDYMHNETSATPLMVAAGRGFLSQIEQLLSMGASVRIKYLVCFWTALDWAKHFQQAEVVDLLESYLSSLEAGKLDEWSLVQAATTEMSPEDQELLKEYHHNFDDERVDLDLIMHLLQNICTSSEEGAVLIFLPGYDEIVGLRDRILYNDKRFADHSQRYQVFTLHSNMQTSDQKKVLKNTPAGVQKIILSTNIAETSITVNDVVFVIDAGKKSFDALNHVTMLKMVWISKASSLQQKGRAGRCRPGICFHLFSRLRFNNMLEYQVPQLLRMSLNCLHTKLLAPITCPIAEFLSKAPEPPPILIVKNAVQMLKVRASIFSFEPIMTYITITKIYTLPFKNWCFAGRGCLRPPPHRYIDSFSIVCVPPPGFVRARGGGDIRDVNLNSENWSVVKAALVAGMYPNLIHVDRESCSLSGAKEKRVRFHPTSVLSQTQPHKKVASSHPLFTFFSESCLGQFSKSGASCLLHLSLLHQVHTEHVTDVTESGDAVENVLLPATSSSMTGLAVGQSWCGVAFLWGAAQPSMCSPEVA
uniref:YTH N6-methyladenosine RNA binding protein C2 n=1 Tax=Hucho hucho TaxID=62062 RepID=A0A4W5PYT4_9TELE